jgi:hypothetical protein
MQEQNVMEAKIPVLHKAALSVALCSLPIALLSASVPLIPSVRNSFIVPFGLGASWLFILVISTLILRGRYPRAIAGLWLLGPVALFWPMYLAFVIVMVVLFGQGTPQL